MTPRKIVGGRHGIIGGAMGSSVGCHRRGVIIWPPRKIVGVLVVVPWGHRGCHGVIGGAMGSSGVPWDHRGCHGMTPEHNGGGDGVIGGAIVGHRRGVIIWPPRKIVGVLVGVNLCVALCV